VSISSESFVTSSGEYSSTHTHGLIAPAPIRVHSLNQVLFRIPISGHRRLATSIPLPTLPSLFGSHHHHRTVGPTPSAYSPKQRRFWTMKKTIKYLQAHIRPSPSCSLTVLLVLTARSLTYSSTRSLWSILYSMSPLLVQYRPPYDRTHLQVTKDSSASCLAVRREYCILSKRHRLQCCRSAGRRSSHPNLIFACGSVIHRRAHSCLPLRRGAPAFSDSSHDRPRLHRQPIPLYTLAHANEGS